MYYGDYGNDYGSRPAQKTDAKVDMIVYRIGTVEKYKVRDIDTIYGTLKLIGLDDRNVIGTVTFAEFEKYYKEVWF